MSWERLPPITPKKRGCAFALMQDKLEMDEIIAVGFGDAHVEKDGKIIYREPAEYEIQQAVTNDDALNLYWSVQDAENEALKDPDHDWRIVLYGPLRGRVFQRHGESEWVLVKENMGFA